METPIKKQRRLPPPRSITTIHTSDVRSHLSRIARRLNRDLEKQQLLPNPAFRRFSQRGANEYSEKFEARHSPIAAGPRGATIGGTRPLGPTALLNALLNLGRQKQITARSMRAEQKSNRALSGQRNALTRTHDRKQKSIERSLHDFKLTKGSFSTARRLRDQRVIDMQKLVTKENPKNVYPNRPTSHGDRKVAERFNDDLRR